MLILSSVQFKPNFARCQADVINNFRLCEPLIHEVWKTGSQLVVFPELFLTGYTFLSPEEAAMVAEKHDGPTFRAMKNLAIELNSYVAYGYVESHNGYLYNSSVTIDHGGNVVSRYRKVNLWGNDFLWAKSGDLPPEVAETEFGTLSTIICRDIKAKIPGNIPRTASSKPFFEGTSPQFAVSPS